MVFTSLTFIVFYIIVFALYWPLGKEGQNRLIVLSGLVFYGSWDWRFAVLLLITTGVDFAVGLALEKEDNERTRKGMAGPVPGHEPWRARVFQVLQFLHRFVRPLQRTLRDASFTGDPQNPSSDGDQLLHLSGAQLYHRRVSP